MSISSSVTISRVGDSQIYLDYLTIQSAPIPESTQEPYYVSGTVSGTDGVVETRFDMVVTAGDVAITNSLLFLFFSLWAIIIILNFVGRDRV